MDNKKIKQIVKKHYEGIAGGEKSCCSCSGKNDNERIAREIGYDDKELGVVADANLGLGCGNPTGMAEIKKGETVLDLGSGAGIDCFLAARKVGDTGKVIGVDMSEKMIKLAQGNAKKYNINNVIFKYGDIEKLPIEDESIDVVISNCVINLAPDKSKVFREVYRVLKVGGRMYVSDIVLLKDVSELVRRDEKLIASCVGGALLKSQYIDIIKQVGFKVKVLSEDKKISKKQYNGMPLESIKIEAKK